MRVEMHYKLHSFIIFLCILIFNLHKPMTTCAMYSKYFNMPMEDPFYDLEPNALFESKRSMTCDSCGNECTNACGTKNFRTCCFNYLRKRNDPNAMKSFSNKRLIDFILLQGRAAMYTLDEHNNSGDVGNDGRVKNVDGAGLDSDEKTYDATGSRRRMGGGTTFPHRVV
ncbi:uncharacterized protein LOC105229567 isoform X1 [Bactrocera dorsalis]|uniref:Uncharacterized protein LOC105229567 n=2 Tax=Bactrocera dorsalis TaxID=27457 RepID=A0A034V0W7_BACDO|nr:uncharacterized protein LOC105229567 isoform X1 [Bactrocera dorsalis]